MFGKRNADQRTIDTLASIPLFGAATRDQLAQLAPLFTEVTRSAGSVLTREGEAGNEFFVVVDGTATASVAGNDIAALGRGDFFGEMSLLDRAPRAATVTATTDLELLVADARSFFALVETAPSVGMRMMRTMSERIRQIEAVPVS